jgi:hypothetical protein
VADFHSGTSWVPNFILLPRRGRDFILLPPSGQNFILVRHGGRVSFCYILVGQTTWLPVNIHQNGHFICQHDVTADGNWKGQPKGLTESVTEQATELERGVVSLLFFCCPQVTFSLCVRCLIESSK